MKAKSFKYRIIIEKEKKDNGEQVYIAYAPSLGISDFGQTVDKAVSNIEKAIKLYVETLIDLKQPVPKEDTDDFYVTTRKIEVNTTFAYST
jgi:predicted RNase H-like HicB family nuclease